MNKFKYLVKNSIVKNKDEERFNNLIFDGYDKKKFNKIDSSLMTNIKYDLKFITTEYLVRNIELAFEVKKNKWCKNLRFDDFCEYVLPYRVSNEPLTNWREKAFSKFKSTLNDTSLTTTELIKIILDSLKEFRYNRVWEHNNIVVLGYDNLLNVKAGNCGEKSMLNIFVFRALGIAISEDYVDLWGNRNWGHGWNAFINEKNNFDDFEPFASSIDFYKVKRMKNTYFIPDEFGKRVLDNTNEEGKDIKIAKVFRKTFSSNKNEYAKAYKEVDLKFLNYKYINTKWKDITDSYISNSDFDLKYNYNHNCSYYVNVFNNGKWQNIFYGIPNIIDSKIIFKNLGHNICYIITENENGHSKFISKPFILKTNTFFCLNGSNRKVSISIDKTHPTIAKNKIDKYSTYQLFSWNGYWHPISKFSCLNSDKINLNHVYEEKLYLLLKVDRVNSDQRERIFYIHNSEIVWV